MEDIDKKIARYIGWFYFDKNNRDYEATYKAISSLRITKIEFMKPEIVVIKLARPGLLIGSKGENIKALHDYLNRGMDWKDCCIHIVEDTLYSYLIPVDYTEGDFDF